ncbi:MAG: DUF4832 domain-containing protein [Proteobacteria bacterium]|nr:DUF4832 domain-containing protein [Pseudomonadota bacterium]
MQRAIRPPCSLYQCALLGLVVLFACTPGDDDDTGDDDDAGPGLEVTVDPAASSEPLVNPGIGFADFHFGWWCNLPPITFTPEECADRVRANWPENHPDSGTAYFRWTWAEIEPVRGVIDFDLIDNTMQTAALLGQSVSFRIITVQEGGRGMPDWLAEAPYSAAELDIDGLKWPDYRDETFQAEHQRMVAALAARYGGHPSLDHVDIGPVGCWGEWNTACISATDLFSVYSPEDAAAEQAIVESYESLVDHYLDAFSETPLVMLLIGGPAAPLETQVGAHAAAGGAGWRADCWGDWGYWGPNWNHHEDIYPQSIEALTAAYADFPSTWERAPVVLETCGTWSTWVDLGWTAEAPDGEVYRSFEWALEQHSSLINSKYQPFPESYLEISDDYLTRGGYRIRLGSLSHSETAAPGGPFAIRATWSNDGVAPMYHSRDVRYRLNGQVGSQTFVSSADTREWLPGEHTVDDVFTVDAGLQAGVYSLEVAIVSEAGVDPLTVALSPVRLANEEQQADGWLPVSELTVE